MTTTTRQEDTAPVLGVSSWSVRHLLGPTYPGLALISDARPPDATFGPGTLDLLDLPEAARAHGVSDLDLCHFHLPRTDAAYLDALRARLDMARVRLLTLLIDDGDISAPDAAARERDRARIEGWIAVAARLSARYVRVVAGMAMAGPNSDAIARSIEGLTALARYARARGVGVLTENWRALALSPENLRAILEATGGGVGLCADFGNYKGEGKYDDLRAILPYATTVHAKAEFLGEGVMDDADFRHCLSLAREAGFAGTYVLIFSGPGDEWAGILRIAATVRDAC